MWIAITEAALQTGITGPELDAARSAALAEEQADPVPEVIQQVTRQVRGYVANCDRNTMGEGETIPDECLGAAVSLVVQGLCKRLPGKVVFTEERATAAADAVNFLRDVASCRFRIAQPEVQSTEKLAAPGPRITPRKRRLSTDCL